MEGGEGTIPPTCSCTLFEHAVRRHGRTYQIWKGFGLRSSSSFYPGSFPSNLRLSPSPIHFNAIDGTPACKCMHGGWWMARRTSLPACFFWPSVGRCCSSPSASRAGCPNGASYAYTGLLAPARRRGSSGRSLAKKGISWRSPSTARWHSPGPAPHQAVLHVYAADPLIIAFRPSPRGLLPVRAIPSKDGEDRRTLWLAQWPAETSYSTVCAAAAPDLGLFASISSKRYTTMSETGMQNESRPLPAGRGHTEPRYEKLSRYVSLTLTALAAPDDSHLDHTITVCSSSLLFSPMRSSRMVSPSQTRRRMQP
ncbi:hypothetical protein VTK56DRAFT_7472 [Thermocarpiscus australiensis]